MLNLSFGGYTMHNAGAIALDAAVQTALLHNPRLVVVAAAGNDSSSRPLYPAASPQVVAVTALDGENLAEFSNRGPWVDACAPGVDVRSTFIDWQGPLAPPPRPGEVVDPASLRTQDFRGWARWSGTSLAAPLVAARLAVLIAQGLDGPAAVHELIRRPELPRVPGGGTVIIAR